MQIPLGVLPKDENKLEDMVCILEHIHGYVPTVEQERTIQDTRTGETSVVKEQLLHQVILAGDQLTVARARSCQRGRGNSDTSVLSSVVSYPLVSHQWV